MQLVLISGLSGSGKSVALHALEDSGYFAVDNLPAILIPALVESQRNNRRSTEKIAISIDARTSHTLDALPRIIEDLREHEIDCRTVFLEANDEALTRRFSESRRPHPMAQRVGAGGGIESCIAEERRILMPIASLAHRIETSGVSTNTLRTWIKDWLHLDQSRITLAFQSFGFKHNLPIDADLHDRVGLQQCLALDHVLHSLSVRMTARIVATGLSERIGTTKRSGRRRPLLCPDNP